MPPFTDPVRSEIWSTIREVNDAWTKGDPADLAHWFHRDMVAITPAARHRLEGRAACVAGWKGFAENARIHSWQEIDPVIHVHGEAAVVAYEFALTCDLGGGTIELGGRDMFFLIREGGRWWVVADQFSPYPEEG